MSSVVLDALRLVWYRCNESVAKKNPPHLWLICITQLSRKLIWHCIKTSQTQASTVIQLVNGPQRRWADSESPKRTVDCGSAYNVSTAEHPADWSRCLQGIVSTIGGESLVRSVLSVAVTSLTKLFRLHFA